MSKLDARAGGVKAPEAAQRSQTQTSEERRYRAEDALRNATTYHKNMSDPNLVKDMQNLAREQMKHLATVAGHAGGATTRTGSSPDTRTNKNPPKAASRSGNTGGGGSGKSASSTTSKRS